MAAWWRQRAGLVDHSTGRVITVGQCAQVDAARPAGAVGKLGQVRGAVVSVAHGHPIGERQSGARCAAGAKRRVL